MANEERPALAERWNDGRFCIRYPIRLSSLFCKRFHPLHPLISLQFAANAYTFKGPGEIARRSDERGRLM